MLAFEIATHRDAWVVRGARVYVYNHRYIYRKCKGMLKKTADHIWGLYSDRT